MPKENPETVIKSLQIQELAPKHDRKEIEEPLQPVQPKGKKKEDKAKAPQPPTPKATASIQ